MTGIAQAFTAALFHFVWEGAVAAFALSLALFLLRRRPASVRYLAGCVALSVMAILPVLTAWAVYEPATGSGEIVSEPLNAGRAPLPVIGSDVLSALPTAAAMGIARDWAIPVWALGVVFFSLRLLWGYAHVVRLRRSAAPSAAAFATAIRVARRMRVTRRFKVMVSSFSDGPGVVGWLRPVVLLPPATALGLTPEQLEAVLAHELAHIRRYDYLVNLMQTLVEALLFYHPAVWWVSARVRRERELCCDDVAVETIGNALHYARALAALERLRLGPPQLALAASGGSLPSRIRRIMGRERETSRLSPVSGMIALALGAAALGCAPTIMEAGTQLAANEIPEPPPPPPAPPAAPVPATPPLPGSSQFFGTSDDDGVAWVLFRNGRTMTFGSSVDQAEARIDRRNFEGDLLWARFDGGTYVIQDEAFLEDVDALMEPLEVQGDQMRRLGEQMRGLGDEMRQLGEQMREVRVDMPDLTDQIEEIRTMLASETSVQDLGRLQAEIGRLQSAIGRLQSDAGRQQAEIGRQQALIGRQQAEIGRQQAAVGRQQAEASREAGEGLVEMIEEAIESGLARQLD